MTRDKAANVLLAVSVAAAAFALWLAVVPGRFENVLVGTLFFGAIAVFTIGPIALPVALLALWSARRRGRLSADWLRLEGPPVFRRAAAAAGVLFSAAVAVRFAVPQRVGFALSRGAFERQLTGARPDGPVRLGAYCVFEIQTDDRGGVYFATSEGSCGLGPDVTTYGFAHEPTAEGSPFGAAYYATRSLGGGWHAFEACDDWY